MFQNTACGHTKHSWICTKILSRNLLLVYCNVLIRNLKIMPQIWKRCCEYNNVSHNVNIICTKMIVPDYNAYKSNCRSKVSCTLDKIYLLTTQKYNMISTYVRLYIEENFRHLSESLYERILYFNNNIYCALNHHHPQKVWTIHMLGSYLYFKYFSVRETKKDTLIDVE
jgi:hypothetical protein